MSIFKKIAVLATITCSVAISVPVLAQEANQDLSKTSPSAASEHRTHLGPMKRIESIKQLSSLTEEQKQKIDDIVSSFKSDMKPLMQQMHSIKVAAKNAEASPSSDTAGSDKNAAANSDDNKSQLIGLRKQMHQLTKQTMQKVFAVLTDEQRAQLKQMHRQTQPATPSGANSDADS